MSRVLAIFDWDDSLCPTTALKEADPVVLERHRSKLFDYIAQLYQFLDQVSDHADLVILTYASLGWFEQSLEEYFAEIAAVFDPIPKYSCRDPLTNEFVTDKTEMMKQIVTERFDPSVHRKVISVGDSDWERKALLELKVESKLSLRLARNPSVDDLRRQLSFISLFWESLTYAPKLDVDWAIRLTDEQIRLLNLQMECDREVLAIDDRHRDPEMVRVESVSAVEDRNRSASEDELSLRTTDRDGDDGDNEEEIDLEAAFFGRAKPVSVKS